MEEIAPHLREQAGEWTTGLESTMRKFTSEEWRQVPGHPDYDVSSLGRVRSWKNRLRGHEQARVLRCNIHPLGYIRVRLDNKAYGVHQVVAAAFIGPCPEGMEVDHINEVRGDNRAVNLCYLTRQANLARRFRDHKPGTHCRRGHPLDGSNLYIHPKDGVRSCNTCRRIHMDNHKKRIAAVGWGDCSMPGCDRKAKCRLRSDSPICEMHYQRERYAAKRASA